MNRFDYFSDIEDEFIRQRGRALILSPLDWELIEQWKDAGIPLHVVIHAIGDVFANHKASKRRRPIASLSYCKSEVEAQFKEWQAGRVGAHESEPGAVATGSAGKSPFPKDEVIKHLRRRRQELKEPHDRWALSPDRAEEPDQLLASMRGASARLIDLIEAFQLDGMTARDLEAELVSIELLLDAAIVETSTSDQVAEARAAAEALYSPYKGKMPEKVYDQQIDNELKKRLRAIFGVPRLSLFHMKGF